MPDIYRGIPPSSKVALMISFKYLSILFLSFLSWFQVAKAQTCDCVSHFEWVKETFETNDAGFAFALERKGEVAYQRLNEETLQRVQAVTDLKTCVDILEEWLYFFRKGHIGIQQLAPSKKTEKLSKSEIRDKFQDWERLDADLRQLEKELRAREKDGFEGIWKSGTYRIAIVEKNGGYLGSILKAKGSYWTPGQIKLKITPNGDSWSSVYYMKDHSENRSESAHLLDANHLLLGDIDLRRVKPKLPSQPAVLNYLKAMEARKPYLALLDQDTYYLRLPSFSLRYKKAIDRLMRKNKVKLQEKPYLIIDLRDNGGGADGSYAEILPFLYTAPIEFVGVSMLSSPLNISALEKISSNRKVDEETRKALGDLIPKLEANPGGFVSMEEEEVSLLEMDEVHPQPQKVAILINKGNASSAEEFLLAARQSSKVRLFGYNTAGVLDISNVNIVTSPGGEFRIGYAMSKSHRIPEQAIDDIGITPDVVIPDEKPDHQWVEFVMQQMKEE